MRMVRRVRVERRKRSENRENSTKKYERDEDEENGSFGASLLRHGHQFGGFTATLLRSDFHSFTSLTSNTLQYYSLLLTESSQ